jgi:hypothetical protein
MTKFLSLSSYSLCPLDFIPRTPQQLPICINTNFIVSIVKHTTIFNKINIFYYCITLHDSSALCKQKIYVNNYNVLSSNLFNLSTTYEHNLNYDVVQNFIEQNNVVTNTSSIATDGLTGNISSNRTAQQLLTQLSNNNNIVLSSLPQNIQNLI